jgi:hypothetical protein
MVATTGIAEFVAECKKLGWKIRTEPDGRIVRLCKEITPNDVPSFREADYEYGHLVSFLKYSGSVWGTDGGGVGALAAMRTGTFVINVSEVKVRQFNELSGICLLASMLYPA